LSTAPGFADCSYELRHALMSRSAFLTFGIDNAGTDPTAVAVGVSAAFGATGSLFTAIDSQVTLVRTRVALGTDGGEDNVGLSSQVIACTATLNSTPPNCAVLVHKRTSRGGRRGRGRLYIPWAASNALTSENGSVIAADITRVQNAVTAWSNALSSGPGALVLLHRPSAPGTGHPTSPGPPDVVSSMSVDPLIGTQRRRLGR
jgi:hypothetical protein